MSLSPETKELVGIGISVAINCTHCLDYHMKQAKLLNIDDKDVAEVIRMVRDMKINTSSKLFQYAGQKLNQDILSCTGPVNGQERQSCC